MKKKDILEVIEILHKLYPLHPMHQAFGDDPFKMLVAVILSQRATDIMTIPTAKKLFSLAHTPQQMVDLDITLLENCIHSIGFYHQKATSLKKLSTILIEEYNGKVPSKEEQLLSLPQVGRKTANIILTMFFKKPQIAVDVHVHRISNRLGWIATTSPEESEKELTKIVPIKYVPIINEVFVQHGQQTCRPIHPKCSQCPISKYCKKVGVK